MAGILLVLGLIVGVILINELNVIEFLFHRRKCQRCRGSMIRSGITDPMQTHVLHDHKVELKCKRCGTTSWITVKGKSTGGGD